MTTRRTQAMRPHRPLAGPGRPSKPKASGKLAEIAPARLVAYKEDPWLFLRELVIPAAHGDAKFGDVMADFQRERFEKMVPCMKALAAKDMPPTRRHWWEGTKGTSKDTDLAMVVLWLTAFATRQLRIQVGAVDADQAGELRRAAESIMTLNPWLWKRLDVFKFQIQCRKTLTTAVIESADQHSSHGARPDLMIVNELHAIQDQETANNWLDNANKVPWGIIVVATNAGFVNTWQWRLRETYRQMPEAFFHKWDKPAPWVSESDIAEARARNSVARFNRLWGGVWVPGTGDAIDPDDVEACVTLDGLRRPPQDGWVYFAGLDLGVKNDHSALVILGAKPGEGRVRLHATKRWMPGPNGKVDLIEVQRETLDLLKEYEVVWLGFDPSQAHLMAQQLTVALRAWPIDIVEIVFAGKALDLMARCMMTTFREHRVELFRDHRLLQDIFRLTIAEKPFGYKLEAVSDEAGHADEAIALAIVLPAAMDCAMSDVQEEPGAVYRVVA